MTHRISCGLWLAFGLLAGAAAPAAAQGYAGYPYTIMTPEPGTAGHHRAVAHRARQAGAPQPEKPQVNGQPMHRNLRTARGSSGSVLPAPLPRTQLIPPEGGGIVATHPLPQDQGPTVVPGAPSLGAIPNLPQGSETFQDRASRCAFQQGLNGVPGTASSQYMGACVQ
jgi:hypothetical protein